MNKIIILIFGVLIILGWNKKEKVKIEKFETIHRYYMLKKADAG